MSARFWPLFATIRLGVVTVFNVVPVEEEAETVAMAVLDVRVAVMEEDELTGSAELVVVELPAVELEGDVVI